VRRIVLLITLLLLSRSVFAAPTTAQAGAIQTLIENLADPDPATRQHAAEKLTAMGFAARPALVEAARSNSPQIASRAAEVLMKLPWWTLSDPDTVREQLIRYGNANNDERKQIIQQIFLTPGGEPALLRLVQEEPSDAVAWYAVSALRAIENDKIARALRKMDLTDARTQVIALAARALLPVDYDKAIELFRQAIEDDSDDDGSDDAHLGFAYRVLISDALDKDDLAGALKLQRLRVHRAASGGDASAAAFGLFALYADFHSTDAFEDDVEECAAYLGRPEIMYALARIDDSPLMSDAIDRCALAASFSPESHAHVASIVSERAWNPQARQELYAVLATYETKPDISRMVVRYYNEMALARLAEVNDDHLAVADHLDAAMQDSETWAGAMQFDLSSLRNQVAWHRLHAAREANDKQLADKLLGELLEVPDPDSDVAIEVVNVLKSQGRTEEAKKYFQKSYDAQSVKVGVRSIKIDGTLTEAAGPLNDLAWLCARTGERRDEAVRLAERAVALDPANYMLVDTAASAYYAAGDAAKAVVMEKRALKMRPCDTFMQGQLRMFSTRAGDGPAH
jgi:tetratricopeptide (TPR) repeat protein